MIYNNNIIMCLLSFIAGTLLFWVLSYLLDKLEDWFEK
jgi:ABC-type antimicrobial peptide transport system permease subunit